MRSALQKAREAPSSTKARILATAEEVFAAKGFAGASTREIASKAGVNISSLHYHWESKETLYFAVFQNIYDRILDLVRTSIPRELDSPEAGRAVVEASMGALFDFFADHPNVPKLLIRRLLENDEGEAQIERDILVPAWRTFASWMQEHSGRKLDDMDANLFMLTLHGVLLLYLLDSRHFTSLLGGSVYEPEIRRHVRAYIIDLVPTLLGRGRRE
jgi:AcrR family transcriptional regulator